MADPTTTRRFALLFVVLGILAVLAVMVLVAVLSGGDDTSIDPQNGKLVTTLVR
jgi:ABC-type transporter Mla subunit MlaD